MSVSLEGSVIRLVAPCRIEDAEPLVLLLLDDRTRVVDVTAAGFLHSAVVQALVAFRPPIAGPADDLFVAAWLPPD